MSANESNGYPIAGDIIDGKYQIERMLGEGGMGAVARAVHLLLRAPVALKFMNPQFMTFPGAVERFLNEGIASKAIKSEHVVQVDDVGKLPSGAPYLVMDCLDGLDLSQLLAEEGKPGLEIERVIHFVVQILRGLQVAHAIGVIHRDMKPSNCFVVKHEGQPDFVKILDFGISKVQQPGSASLTQTNSALGTPLYMSPEQARSPRDVDARSDIYSVGVILYELLSGHTPFNSESGEFTEILFKLFTAEVPRIEADRPDISKELADAVHKALAREVADRYQSAAEFAEGLAPFAAPKTLLLIDRLKHYQPESRSSIMPRPENSPSSALAFSALQGGAQTNARPGTAGHIAIPVSPHTQASPSEAHARTQISSHDLEPQARQATQLMQQQRGTQALQGRPAAQSPPAGQTGPASRAPVPPTTNPGVRTDLSVARDTTEAEVLEAAPQKRSPAIFLVPVIALVAIIGVGVAVKMRGGGATADPTPNATGLVQVVAPEPTTPIPTTTAATIATGATVEATKDAGVTAAKIPTLNNNANNNNGRQPPPPPSNNPGNNGNNTARPPNVLDNNLAN